MRQYVREVRRGCQPVESGEVILAANCGSRLLLAVPTRYVSYERLKQQRTASNQMDIAEIRDDFSFLDDWEDKYRYVIELGKKLPDLPDAERTERNKVRGCVSQVWLATRQNGDRLHFEGDSDALIVRGLVAILLAIYQDRTPKEILATDAREIFGDLGLKDHLTPQRSNGFVSMVDRIQSDAKAALAA